MNQQLLEELQNVVETSKGRIDKLRETGNVDSAGNENNLSQMLDEILIDLQNTLEKVQGKENSFLNTARKTAEFSAIDEISKKGYYRSTILSMYIESMTKMLELEDAVEFGHMNHYDAMRQLKNIVATMIPYSKMIEDMNNQYITSFGEAFASAVKRIYNNLAKKLTPEQIKEINQTRPEIKSAKKDESLEFNIKENDNLKNQISKQQELLKDTNSFDDRANAVLEKFKKLDLALEVDSYEGMTNFDPDRVMSSLNNLKDSVFDLNAYVSNANTSKYMGYLQDMTKIFNERTKQTRSSFSNFQITTFESSIPRVRKLLENARTTDERSVLVKKFTENAAWYMHGALMILGQSKEHVNAVMTDVNSIIRDAHILGTAKEYEIKEDNAQKTEMVRNKIREQVMQEVVGYIYASGVAPNLTAKEVEKLAEEVVEDKLDDAETIQSTEKAVAGISEDVSSISDAVEKIADIAVEKIIEEVIPVAEETAKETAIKKEDRENKLNLEKVDMENTIVIKTKQDIVEDIKWEVINMAIEDLFENDDQFKDIDPEIKESIKKTFKILSNDNGYIVQMKDGSKERVQDFLRKFVLSGSSAEQILQGVDTYSVEFKKIIDNLDIVRDAFGKDFIRDSISQISQDKSINFDNIADSLMGEGENPIVQDPTTIQQNNVVQPSAHIGPQIVQNVDMRKFNNEKTYRQKMQQVVRMSFTKTNSGVQYNNVSFVSNMYQGVEKYSNSVKPDMHIQSKLMSSMSVTPNPNNASTEQQSELFEQLKAKVSGMGVHEDTNEMIR